MSRFILAGFAVLLLAGGLMSTAQGMQLVSVWMHHQNTQLQIVGVKGHSWSATTTLEVNAGLDMVIAAYGVLLAARCMVIAWRDPDERKD